MKKIIAALSLITFLSGCNLNTPPDNQLPTKLDSIKIQRDTISGLKEYKGLYRAHNSNFITCDDGKRYVLKNNTILDSLYNNILPNAYADEAVYLEIKAGIDPTGSNLIDMSTGSVIVMEQKNFKNTCLPYEYWCIGTEPFWTIQISKAEDLIDFYNPMEQKTTHFVYSKPEIKNGMVYYSSTDGKNVITITINKEKCNGAIDKQYDHSVQAQLNGKKYSGCAIKYSE